MVDDIMNKQDKEKNQARESQKVSELIQQKIILEEINKHLEEKIKQLEDTRLDRKDEVHNINEIEQQKILLTELNNLLSKNDTDVGKVLTNLSHEFKTPMVPIKAYTELLLEGQLGELTDEQKERLMIMKNSISLLHELVSDSIESKQLELGQITMNKTKTDLTKIINNVLKKFNAEKRNDIRIYFSPKEDIIVLCDSDKISQVMTNLIKNSIKAIPKEKGKISIEAAHDEKEVMITVKDNGKGVPKDKLSTLFSKFGKVDNSETRDDTGVGLGLYLCKQIIDAHGGRIWIESQEKIETNACFTLPK